MLSDNPRSILDTIQRILAEMGRVPGSRFVNSVDVGAVAAGDQSTPSPIIFPGAGYAIALYGQTVSATPSATALDFAQTSFRLQYGGTDDLTVDGRGAPDFLPFLGAFGGVANWQPVLRRVNRGDLWLVTFKNDSAVAQTPKLSISFISDEDAAKLRG